MGIVQRSSINMAVTVCLLLVAQALVALADLPADFWAQRNEILSQLASQNGAARGSSLGAIFLLVCRPRWHIGFCRQWQRQPGQCD